MNRANALLSELNEEEVSWDYKIKQYQNLEN